MKTIEQLMLGYLTAAFLGMECCINPKILPATVGAGDGNLAVKAILVAPENTSYNRSISGTNSAIAELFVDKSSYIEPVNTPTYNFIDSEKNSGTYPSFSLKQISFFLVFISLAVSLLLRRNKIASLLSKASCAIKPNSQTVQHKLPQGETILEPKKPQDIGDTIAKMTQDLQQTAEYALDICEEMSVSIIATTPGGHILSLNQATCQLLGYSKKDLLGKQIAGIFKQTDSPAPGSELANLTAEYSVKNVEQVYISKECKKIIVLLSISTIRDDKGNVSGKLYVAQDMTDSKRAERDLRRSEKKFRQLIETVNAAAFIYQRRQLRYVNSQTEDMTGYTREELLALDL